MKSIIYNILFIFTLFILFTSCKDEIETTHINPTEGLTKLQSTYVPATATKMEIWGKKNFFMGYNKLTIILLDSASNDTIKDAHIHLMPVMTMGSVMMAMQHACPVENPDEEAVNGAFQGAVAFVMPTSTDGSWKLSVAVHNHQTDKEGTATLDVTVDNPATAVMSVFTATTADASKLVLSLVEPSTPKVGMNDIEFTLHRKESMMSWPADSTYSIEITPEMPSMGHGSPNNVNPTHTANGHYKGKVNFTMTGEWKINVAVKKDGATVSNNTNFIVVF